MNCSDKMGQNGLDQNKFLKKKKKPFLKKKNKTKKKTDFKIYPTYTVPSDTHTHKVPSPSYWSTIPRIFIFHFTYWTLCRLLKREGNKKKKKNWYGEPGGGYIITFSQNKTFWRLGKCNKIFVPFKVLAGCFCVYTSTLPPLKHEKTKQKNENLKVSIGKFLNCTPIARKYGRENQPVYKNSVLLCVYCVCMYTTKRSLFLCRPRVCVWYTRREKQRDWPMFSFSQTLSTERNGLYL